MNYAVKPGFDFSYVDVYIHQTCLIVAIQKKNTLYEFKDADKMILDLSLYLEPRLIEHMKGYIMDNCSKVKFTNKSEPPEQLSLF